MYFTAHYEINYPSKLCETTIMMKVDFFFIKNTEVGKMFKAKIYISDYLDCKECTIRCFELHHGIRFFSFKKNCSKMHKVKNMEIIS